MPPISGETIELGGKTRILRYSFHSLDRLERELGQPLRATAAAATRLSARAIAGLAWAGLLHAEPKLTIQQVTAMIEPPLVPLLKAIGKALEPWSDVEEAEDEAGAGAEAGDAEGAEGNDIP